MTELKGLLCSYKLNWVFFVRMCRGYGNDFAEPEMSTHWRAPLIVRALALPLRSMCTLVPLVSPRTGTSL